MLITEKAQSKKLMEKAMIVKDFLENPFSALIVANTNGAIINRFDIDGIVCEVLSMPSIYFALI